MTKTDSMVERVAKAMKYAQQDYIGDLWQKNIPWKHEDLLRVSARAAIQAMQEPDEVMLKAAIDSDIWGGTKRPSRIIRENYQAIIQAALEQGE